MDAVPGETTSSLAEASLAGIVAGWCWPDVWEARFQANLGIREPKTRHDG
jgi:hypothetical protein